MLLSLIRTLLAHLSIPWIRARPQSSVYSSKSLEKPCLPTNDLIFDSAKSNAQSLKITRVLDLPCQKLGIVDNWKLRETQSVFF